MPLSFLAPLFLAGVLAVAVPIIVHLTHRQREDVQRFPSLMFVRRVPYRSTRKQRIRHWFLLLLRAAALILIAGAFARPFMDRPLPSSPAGRGARELVVLLDRSYSMAYEGRWDAAVAAAREALAGVRPGERATLVLFDERAEAVRDPDGGPAGPLAALGRTRPGFLATRLAPALRQARSAIETTRLPRAEVVLISDLQRGGPTSREPLELPERADLRVVDVGRDAAPNVAVAGVDFARARFAGRDRATATARVVNRGASPVSVAVALELDGREVERKAVRIAPSQAGAVTFAPFTVGDDARGVIRAGSDPLPLDNAFHFVLAPGQRVPVTVVHGPGDPGQATLYVEHALAAGGEGEFSVTRRAATFPDQALRPGGVVIVSDAQLSAGDERRLRRFVESGGGLLVAAGERGGSWREDLLPARIRGGVDRDPASPGRLAAVEYSHPAFEAFRAPHAGDFTAGRFYRYRELDAPGDSAVLARFDDGRPALAVRQVGRGRVLLWASTLDNVWNDLPVQPVFAPFLREAVRWLAGAGAEPAWRTAGELLDAAPWLGTTGNTNSDAELTLLSPGGLRTALRPGGAAFAALDEPGFYRLRVAGQMGQPAAHTVAVNLDVAESDLSRMTEAELRAAITMAPAPRAAAAEAAASPIEHERRQSVWWYLLILAALLLAAESVVSNRLSRVARA